MLEKLMQRNQSLKVRVAADQVSNVVHTVTIVDCLELVAKREIAPGIYTLVNVPQWSWGEVFSFYNHSNAQLHFEAHAKLNGNLFKRGLQRVVGSANTYRKHLREARQFLPALLDRKLQRTLMAHRLRGEIAALEDESAFSMNEFAYRAVPGRQLEGLRETSELLRLVSAWPPQGSGLFNATTPHMPALCRGSAHCRTGPG
jgi:hypothetical protein